MYTSAMVDCIEVQPRSVDAREIGILRGEEQRKLCSCKDDGFYTFTAAKVVRDLS